MLDTMERPKTLKEGALEKLREAITLGYFKPGERLVERVLCEKLGVSRTVIRECIRHLESERLVTVIPNAGPTVAVLRTDDVIEIYNIRMMLESAAVRSCAKAATTQTVADLRQSVASIRRALATDDIVEALRVTEHFYETIFMAGGKSVSWDLVVQLNSRISRLRAFTLASKGRAVAGPKNLRAIVDAISAGNSGAAVKACETHLKQASRVALSQLENLNEKEGS